MKASLRGAEIYPPPEKVTFRVGKAQPDNRLVTEGCRFTQREGGEDGTCFKSQRKGPIPTLQSQFEFPVTPAVSAGDRRGSDLSDQHWGPKPVSKGQFCSLAWAALHS